MPRPVPDKVRLLHGPYEPPPLRQGARTTCLYRDADVVITGWSDGRISWPRCRALGVRGGSGLLVCEELARAGTEGSRRLCRAAWERAKAAVRGKPLSPEQVEERRRRALELNLGQYLDPGHGAGWWEGELALLGKLPDAEVARQTGRTRDAVRQKRQELRLPNPDGGRPGWTEEELSLLGTLPDAEVARRTARTEGAVTHQRNQLGIPTAADRRRARGAC
jgi:hypothetical protein